MNTHVRDEYVLLGDLRFHYRDWGDRSAPPLVVLHGFTGHARSWDSFAAAMAAHYRVLCLDQRGHGESDWTEDYSTPAMVEDLRAFVRALGLASYDLLGLSMGGSNAIHFAGSNPQGLERLVIVDIGPEILGAGSGRIASGLQASDTFETPEEAIAAGRRANPRADEHELQHRVRNNLLLTADGKWTYRYDRRLRDASRPRPRPNADENWAAWKRINAPTLLIRGSESDILARPIAEKMLETNPDCRFVEVAGSGHSIPLEAPRGFLEAVRTFL
jgi:pimeloyl-ACP methyl ester carboxylesterase